MAGYTKLWSTIITSSIWSEDDKTRIMWITMLAACDATGFVSGSIPGMAVIARMSLEDATKSIEKLCSPDPYSRSKESGGRRLTVADGGWQIVTYLKHRTERDPEIRREQNREAKRRERKRKEIQDVSQKVSQSQPCQPKSAHAEAEAEAEEDQSADADCSPKRKTSARTYRITFDYSGCKLLGVTDADLKTWKEAYPAVDIHSEIKRAEIWLGDNPTKRKKNVAGFLSRWFTKSQERGGTKQQPKNFNSEGFCFDLVTHELSPEEDYQESLRLGWPWTPEEAAAAKECYARGEKWVRTSTPKFEDGEPFRD